jgi:catechol 2,3-dioxygenase-like lactoylglutathione lyase family enzyme
MKLRVGEPWMPAKEYGRSLRGLTVNLLVADIGASLAFQRDVLGADVVYSDPDFAVCSRSGAEWMIHTYHTYDNHPMLSTVSNTHPRGGGLEIRLHGCDPDAAEAAARRLGFEILSQATDKGHGLREIYIRDPDGYIWVPDVHSQLAQP